MVALLSEAFRECGHVPSYRPIAAMIQLANGGRGVRAERVRESLKKQAGTHPGRDFPSCGTQPGLNRDISAIAALDDRVRADLNGFSLVDASETTVSVAANAATETSVSSPSEQMTLLDVSGTKKRRRALKPEPTEKQLRTWAIRDAIARIVEPHLRGMTISRWKMVWTNVAADLSDAGVTPDQAVDAWLAHYNRTGIPIIKLSSLQDRIAQDAAKNAPAEEIFEPFWDENDDVVR